MQLQPLTELAAQPLLSQTERSHAAVTRKRLQLPRWYLVNTLLGDQLPDEKGKQSGKEDLCRDLEIIKTHLVLGAQLTNPEPKLKTKKVAWTDGVNFEQLA